MTDKNMEFQQGLFTASDIVGIGEDPFDRGKETVFYKNSEGRRCYVWVENLRETEQKALKEIVN